MRQKLRRLREEKDTRRLIAVILGGKLLGIVGVLGAMKAFAWLLDSAAWAQSAQPIVHKANDFVCPVNTIWVLVTAFLVFFMQAGVHGSGGRVCPLGLEIQNVRGRGYLMEQAPG